MRQRCFTSEQEELSLIPRLAPEVASKLELRSHKGSEEKSKLGHKFPEPGKVEIPLLLSGRIVNTFLTQLIFIVAKSALT
ncbi:hypothetical protein DSO57_1010039 [Entomophthora muscae]|uniref:Uncharacterized protein n=1 Tax=Entomophthora muscae TaxID=34485 RepID=A0ACC2RXS3_9FUNG|nr:hypothetical protein DSO57_1010039 [Entomophthora muscae]